MKNVLYNKAPIEYDFEDNWWFGSLDHGILTEGEG
jgi:hypothetical protein